MTTPDRETFRRLAERDRVVAVHRRIMSDQLTPVLAYRRLVTADQRTAPSFLLESVEGGAAIGRHSIFGARPAIEVLARGSAVTIVDHRRGERRTERHDDPLAALQSLSRSWTASRAAMEEAVPGAGFTGGWVGYAGYDTVRWLEPDALPFEAAPPDDRGLPDLHFGLYLEVGVFDHVTKMLHAISLVRPDEHPSIDEAYDLGVESLEAQVEQLMTPGAALPAGEVKLDLAGRGTEELASATPPGGYERGVERVKDYIAAGDAFQVVLSQRFERRTTADPFEIYRALRVVNPSPYMIYLQAEGSILIASSPEILCRVSGDAVVNRPLAGTRRRGASLEEDRALEVELRADEKETAEHVMLVDLGRNDLGRVCERASVRVEQVMDVERYSHVMHLSSTVTGRLRAGLDAWDALRSTLPVGTVSGAPKIRAMQIIDELEPVRRGPYAGGIGAVALTGDMDIAIALRTMVVPTAMHRDGTWSVHLQAGAGIVADSVPRSEHEETVSKAAGLSRAIDLAEQAYRSSAPTVPTA